MIVARGVKGWLKLAQQVTSPKSAAIKALGVYATVAYDPYASAGDTQAVLDECRKWVFAGLRDASLEELELVSELVEAVLRRKEKAL